jgi:hypothetical protein
VRVLAEAQATVQGAQPALAPLAKD